jgi:hypothetical protein
MKENIQFVESSDLKQIQLWVWAFFTYIQGYEQSIIFQIYIPWICAPWGYADLTEIGYSK